MAACAFSEPALGYGGAPSAIYLSVYLFCIYFRCGPLKRVVAVSSSAPAASRSGQDLHRASIGLRSLASIIGLRSLVSIDSIIAASSPLPRRHLPPALASMAARAGVGNRRRGAGSESGPATTTMGTTKRSRSA